MKKGFEEKVEYKIKKLKAYVEYADPTGKHPAVSFKRGLISGMEEVLR